MSRPNIPIAASSDRRLVTVHGQLNTEYCSKYQGGRLAGFFAGQLALSDSEGDRSGQRLECKHGSINFFLKQQT